MSTSLGKTVHRIIKHNDQEFLGAVFKAIQNPDDSRAPIHATVPNYAASVVREAVIFFTGEIPSMVQLPDNTWSVTSVGYRNGCCGP